MKKKFLITQFLLFFSTFLLANSTYTDDFSTDTTLEYSTEDTWTKGGTGNFNYDATGERAHVLTGNDVALAFSGDLTSSTEGSFSIDFLPVRYYPGGGVFILKLTQDANNFYQIENTDNYGAVEIAKYVNNVKVDSVAFSSEYTQGINYTITVTFSPASTTVEAFGDTLIMDNDATPITVNSFFVDTLQQDAFYDNIVYITNPSEPPSNSAPVVTDDYVTLDENATVTINILQNDNDSDGSIDTDSINIISDVSHGTLSILSDGNVAYVPNSDFSGSDYFTYTVADDDGNISNIATVNITITPYIPASNNSTYTDDFSTDTTLEYSTEDTWTKGGTGNFNYDATGERAHVLTGNDVALAFSGDLTSSTEGSFSIDFLPVRYYPGGGVFISKTHSGCQ